MSQSRDATWRPRLRPGVLIAPISAGRWQARWDFDEVTFLSGSMCDVVLPWLPPLLDGSRTVAELQAASAERCQPTDLSHVLDCLDQQGLLQADDISPTGFAHACEALSSRGQSSTAMLSQTHVAICGRSMLANRIVRAVSDHGMSAIACDLQAASGGFPPFGSETSHTIPVIVETDWRPDELDQFNEFAVAQRRPWMLVGAWPRRVLVGPLFHPGETGCYACYRQRLASHREYLEAYEALDRWQRTRAEPPDPQPLLPAIADLAAAWSALELLAHVTGIRPCRIRGRTLVYQLDEARLSLETVLRIPWCSACGTNTKKVELT